MPGYAVRVIARIGVVDLPRRDPGAIAAAAPAGRGSAAASGFISCRGRGGIIQSQAHPPGCEVDQGVLRGSGFGVDREDACGLGGVQAILDLPLDRGEIGLTRRQGGGRCRVRSRGPDVIARRAQDIILVGHLGAVERHKRGEAVGHDGLLGVGGADGHILPGDLPHGAVPHGRGDDLGDLADRHEIDKMGIPRREGRILLRIAGRPVEKLRLVSGGIALVIRQRDVAKWRVIQFVVAGRIRVPPQRGEWGNPGIYPLNSCGVVQIPVPRGVYRIIGLVRDQAAGHGHDEQDVVRVAVCPVKIIDPLQLAGRTDNIIRDHGGEIIRVARPDREFFGLGRRGDIARNSHDRVGSGTGLGERGDGRIDELIFAQLQALVGQAAIAAVVRHVHAVDVRRQQGNVVDPRLQQVQLIGQADGVVVDIINSRHKRVKPAFIICGIAEPHIIGVVICTDTALDDHGVIADIGIIRKCANNAGGRCGRGEPRVPRGGGRKIQAVVIVDVQGHALVYHQVAVGYCPGHAITSTPSLYM